jgi:hypothetical protein
MEVDLHGIAAQPVVDCLGGAMHRRRLRRGGLAQPNRAQTGQTEEQEKRQTFFHGMPHFKFLLMVSFLLVSFRWISSV